MKLPLFSGVPASGSVPGLSGSARALFLLRLARPVLAGEYVFRLRATDIATIGSLT